MNRVRVAWAGAILATTAIAAIVAPSCAPQTIILADVPVTDAGAPDLPTACDDLSPCPLNSFCQRKTCQDPAGTCTPYPPFCSNDEGLVCGCDGITYYNDCLRQSNAVTADLHDGGCGVAEWKVCAPDGGGCPDPTTQTCVFLLGGFKANACPPHPGEPVTGFCWVLPSSCDDGGAEESADQWVACDDPQLHCKDACNAGKDGKPYSRAVHCGPPSAPGSGNGQ